MNSWTDWYKLFGLIVDKFFGDEETIESSINSLDYMFGDIPEFKTAFAKWNESKE